MNRPQVGQYIAFRPYESLNGARNIAPSAKPSTYLCESTHLMPALQDWDTYRLTLRTITIQSTPKNNCMGTSPGDMIEAPIVTVNVISDNTLEIA